MRKLFFDLSLLPLKVVNATFDMFTGGRRREVFFDIQSTYPSLLQIDEKYETIREELLRILPDKDRIAIQQAVTVFDKCI